MFSTNSAMFVTGITRFFRSICPRGVQNRISLEAAILCNRSEARCLETVFERFPKTSLIRGSSSLLCSSSETSYSLASSKGSNSLSPFSSSSQSTIRFMLDPHLSKARYEMMQLIKGYCIYNIRNPKLLITGGNKS